MPGVCPRCLREVYFAEQKLALGKVWHTFCFTCRNCRKLLDSCTIATHSGDLFCRNCYSRLFSTSAHPALSVSARGKQEIVTKAKNRETLPLKNSTSDYFSDSCCCCCSENYPFSNNKEEISNLRVCSLEKSRLSGGGEQEEIFHLEGRNKCCERENTNLGVLRPTITVCNPQQKSSNSGHWISHHQSASQSTFVCQSCTKSQVAYPLTFPSTGIPEVCRRFKNINNDNNSQSRLRKLENPRRFSKQKPNGEIIDQPQNQFSEYKIIQTDELESNTKPPQPAVSPGLFEKTSLSWTQQHHEQENYFPTNHKSDIKIEQLNRQCSPYPHLPLQYTPSSRRRVSFCNNISEEDINCNDQEGHLTMRNVADGDVLEDEHRSYYNLNFIDSNFCDWNQEAEENDRIELVNRTCTSLETIHEDYCNGRMRGGCGGGGGGGGGCCGGKSRYKGDIDGDYDHEGELDGGRRSGCGCSSGSGSSGYSSRSIKKQSPKPSGCCSRTENNNQRSYEYGASPERQKPEKSGGCCLRSEDNRQRKCGASHMHTALYETCSPREPDACNSFKTSYPSDGCSSPCSGRNGCCPPARCRPLCKKRPRYLPPCRGNAQKCGGGGCCGGGCRGRCGKPGQLCLPLKSCTNAPSQPRRNSGESPRSPPRANIRQPPCCKMPQVMGISGNMSGRSGYRFKSPEGRNTVGDRCCSQKDDEGNDEENDDCDMPKLPPGCECLGSEMDCQRCGRIVYHAEKQVASGVLFHNICFSCFCCRKHLESLTYQENCGEIYCKQCYVRNFGPQGYGYGIGAGVLQTPL